MDQQNVETEAAETVSMVDPSNVSDDQRPRSGRQSAILTEGVLLLLITAAAYLGCYLYELGYANYFGIPPEFISLTIQSLFQFGGRTYALMLGTLYLVDQMIINYNIHKLNINDRAAGVFLRRWGFWIGFAFLVWVANGFEPRSILMSLLLPGIPIAIDLVLPYLNRGEKTYSESVYEYLMNYRSPWAVPNIGVFRRVYGFSVLILVFLVLCSQLGRGEARQRRDFAFLDQQGKQAVLRRYGDLLVIGEFNQKTRNFIPNFQLLKIEEIDRELIVRRIGRTEEVILKEEDLSKPARDKDTR